MAVFGIRCRYFLRSPAREGERCAGYNLPSGARCCIFKRVSKRLGVKIESQTFSTPEKGMEALECVLETGKPVGLLSRCILPALFSAGIPFPFQRAITLVVIRKVMGIDYLISDPIMEICYSDRCKEFAAEARFAKGFPAPRVKDVLSGGSI